MTPLPEIPDALAVNWAQWWPGEAERVARDVRERLGAAVAAWGLTELTPLEGGEVAMVLGARHAGGEVVVKLSPRVGEFAGEGEALALWAGEGIAPAVRGTRDGGLTLMLARLRPGGSLRDAGAGAAQILETIGGLCPRIHLEVAAGSFPSLAEYAAQERWTAKLAGRREHDELAGLLAPGDGDRLLHTDLHWLNVLRGGERWMVIDPKPHIGDPHAETFAFFAGPPLRAIPQARAAAREHVHGLAGGYARAAGLEPDRLLTWIRIRALAIIAEPEVATTPWGQRLSRLVDALG